MWYHMDGCLKQYCFESSIYLLSCLDLECYIIVDRLVGAPSRGKDVFDGTNIRDKLMHEFSTEKYKEC